MMTLYPPPVEELMVWPEGGEVTDIPLPGLSKRGSGSDGLVEEQLADGSLEKLFALARKNEKGYDIVNGILVQRSEDCLGDVVDRIIVPVDRRLQVM